MSTKVSFYHKNLSVFNEIFDNSSIRKQEFNMVPLFVDFSQEKPKNDLGHDQALEFIKENY